jgi:hypothetical protein
MGEAYRCPTYWEQGPKTVLVSDDAFAAADELASTVVLRGAAVDVVRLGGGFAAYAPGAT